MYMCYLVKYMYKYRYDTVCTCAQQFSKMHIYIHLYTHTCMYLIAAHDVLQINELTQVVRRQICLDRILSLLQWSVLQWWWTAKTQHVIIYIHVIFKRTYCDTCTYIHIYMYKRTYCDTCTYIHTYIHVRIYTHTYIRTYMCMYIRTCTYIHQAFTCRSRFVFLSGLLQSSPGHVQPEGIKSTAESGLTSKSNSKQCTLIFTYMYILYTTHVRTCTYM